MTTPLLISTAATVSTIIAGLICTALVVVTVCHLLTKRFRVKRVDADDENGGAGGRVCIGLISDLHFPMIGVSLENVIYTLKKGDCDIVAVAGDLCQNGKGRAAMLSFMKRLSSELSETPIVVVPGNHDCSHVCGKNPEKIGEYCAEIERCGMNITVLRNQFEKFKVVGADGMSIVVVGFDEFIVTNKTACVSAYKEGVSATESNDRLLLLMHNPDIMEHIRDAVESGSKYSVSLAGHTHGGQVYMPFNLEFKLLRGDRLPKKGYVYGLYNYCPNNKLYITCGLGQSFLPIRLGTTPEVAFIYF